MLTVLVFFNLRLQLVLADVLCTVFVSLKSVLEQSCVFSFYLYSLL